MLKIQVSPRYRCQCQINNQKIPRKFSANGWKWLSVSSHL